MDGQYKAELLFTSVINHDAQAVFLNQIAESDPEALHVVIMDQAGFQMQEKYPRIPSTACDLKHGDSAWVRKTLGVVGERIMRELQGVSCLALEKIPAPKKGIASAKSFGRPVESLEELKEALSTYTARAAEKHRAGRLLATNLHVFVTTNPFSPQQPQYSAGAQSALAPSNHTPDLIMAALRLLQEIYRPNYHYKDRAFSSLV